MTYSIRQSLAVLVLLGLAAGALAFFVDPLSSEAILLGQIRKSADQTVTGDVLQNDTELVIPLVKNRTYIIEGSLFISTSSQGVGCKINFTIPVGATLDLGLSEASSNGGIGMTLTENGPLLTDSLDCNEETGLPSYVHLNGTVKMGNTDGNLQLQTASRLSGESTTVQEGSWLRADKL